MIFSEQGKKFLQILEGKRLEAYPDIRGIWTIGYGATTHLDGTKVQAGDVITEQMANELFDKQTEVYANAVNKIANGIALHQYEFDALVSFCYNVGIEAFSTSFLAKELVRGSQAGVIRGFFGWLKPIELLGRRRNEADLFLYGDYKV